MTNIIRGVAVVSVALLAACAAISQQKAQAPATDNLEFHNLQVLPANITHDELLATMRGFTRALGVKCGHCHVANPPGSKVEFDFPNDAKPEKRTARTMLRMVRNVNSNYISKIDANAQNVGCMTCHRGHTVPDVALLPLPERAGSLPGVPPAPQPPPVPPPK
jgi:photosynthetic reaction center cytochrome c subunit